MSKFNFLKKIGIFNALAISLVGCTFNPSHNVEAGVYGPPPMDIEEDYEPGDNIAEPIYGPPVIDEIETPGDNEMSEEDIDKSLEELDREVEEDTDFNPENNIADEVYGPPPEEDYEPEVNMERCVYGPPEWFEDAKPSVESLPENE